VDAHLHSCGEDAGTDTSVQVFVDVKKLSYKGKVSSGKCTKELNFVSQERSHIQRFLHPPNNIIQGDKRGNLLLKLQL